jgi:hypothetical protein
VFTQRATNRGHVLFLGRAHACTSRDTGPFSPKVENNRLIAGLFLTADVSPLRIAMREIEFHMSSLRFFARNLAARPSRKLTLI